MWKGILWIIIGIGVIIFNHSGSDTQLIIKGTGIDFGYLAIIVGIIIMVFNATRDSHKNDEFGGLKNTVEINKQIDELASCTEEIVKMLSEGIAVEQIAEKYEKEKGISKESTYKYFEVLKREIKKRVEEKKA